MPRVLLIGKSGRVDAIADSLVKSRHSVKLFTISEVRNPGLYEKSAEVELGKTDDVSLLHVIFFLNTPFRETQSIGSSIV